MLKWKRLSALALACALVLAMSVTALAHEVPDVTKTGSISLSFVYDGTPVPGGALTAYRVGEVAEDDGNYGFTLSQYFAPSGADLSDITASGLARELAEFATEKELTGTGATIGGDGTAVFSGLTLGLYLVVQTEAAQGYEPVSPFLVSVPMYREEAYVYDVDATPKMETLKKTPEEPPKPTTPVDPNLPKTGQLNWPIPALAILGLCLFLLGWALRYGKNREPHEA